MWLAPPDGWSYRVVTFGRVEKVTRETVHIPLVSGGVMMVNIISATFDYSDAREVLPELRDAVDRDIVCTLQITTPEFRFALGELREQPAVSR